MSATVRARTQYFRSRYLAVSHARVLCERLLGSGFREDEDPELQQLQADEMTRLTSELRGILVTYPNP